VTDDRDLTPLERFSAPLLVQLSRVPRWMLVGVLLGLTVGGLLLENAVGAVLLLILGLFIAWLAVIAWSTLTPVGRLARLVVVGLVVFAAVTRLA
jgi:hypothetical protein